MLSSPKFIALYALGFATALVAAVVLTYLVRGRARRAGLFDPVDARKLHTAPTPRVGGVAIFLAVSVALFGVMLHPAADGAWVDARGLTVVLAGGTLVHLLGLYDDVHQMPARWKLLVQAVIAAGVFAAGVRITALSLPFVGTTELVPILSFAFTVLWLVGITNAFNLIDGLDGLASGAALFALTTMFVVASINGQAGAAVVTVILAGATLGFLVYNFPPASIFLGDSGSLFLGFMLAGVGLLSSQKSQTVVAVAIPVVALGLPVLDTMLAIVRRFLRGQPIFSADRGHIHHRLLSLGHSPKQVALLLYGACAVLALGGMLLVNDSGYVAIVLVVVGLGVGVAVQRLRFYEFEELARLFRKGLQQREVIGRNVRLREAGLRLRGVDDMDELFAALAHVFTTEAFLRAEIRVRQSYMNYWPGVVHDRRLCDDVPVWTWSANGDAQPDWWEVTLPLVHPCGERIGALVMWQDGLASESSLSHVHTVARELREVVQGKLIQLWPSAAYGQPRRRAAVERTVSLVARAEEHRRQDRPDGAGRARGAIPAERGRPREIAPGA